eukprot:gene4909-5153_t
MGWILGNDLHVVFERLFVNAVEDEHAAAAAPHQALAVTHADLKPSSRGSTHYVTAHCSQDSKENMPDVYLLPQVPTGSDKCFSPVKRKSTDQGSVQQLLHHRHPDIKPLMAMSLRRPYTDDDWFAAWNALEQLQRLQQQCALQQLRCAHRSSQASGYSMFTDDDTGDFWHDAVSHTMSDSSYISEAEREEVSRLADQMEQHEHQQWQLTVRVGRELTIELPSCVPNPPLLFADKRWKYCQVDVTPFCAYWERDNLRSTPFPFPVDLHLKLGALHKKTHESIPGMLLREEGDQLLLTAQPALPLVPGLAAYTEYYNKDGSPASWTLRRDVSIGKTTGQMFMTTDGILIFRVFTSGVFSKHVEWVGEDYMRLEDNGATIVCRQLCKLSADSSVSHQFLVGVRKGTAMPAPHPHRT